MLRRDYSSHSGVPMDAIVGVVLLPRVKTERLPREILALLKRPAGIGLDFLEQHLHRCLTAGKLIN